MCIADVQRAEFSMLSFGWALVEKSARVSRVVGRGTERVGGQAQKVWTISPPWFGKRAVTWT